MPRARLLVPIVAVASALMASVASAATATFVYDALGEVTSATYSNGLSISYSYDAAGNRTQQVVAGPPVARAVAQTVAVNSSNNTINLIISGGVPTSVAVSAAASHGTTSVSGATISYTPSSGYTGTDSFQYTATNASGTSDPAIVAITIQ